ncbi:MAG: hypothetical protein KDB61_15555, partial [Planctomycetes bacterium]|nr:hypothetical protein [Planctomycetota bacterium]
MALLLGCALAWRLSIRAALNQRLLDLRQAGFPTTMEELAAWELRDPREAEAEAAFNAVFEHYREMDRGAFEQLPKFERQDPRLLEAPFSPHTRHALEARTAGNDEMLTRFIGAAEFARYRLGIQYTSGHPEVTRDLTRPFEVLCAHACLLAE